MRVHQLTAECVQDLQKLIGSRIRAIYIENLGLRITKGDGLGLEGSGMISILLADEQNNYKWRLRFNSLESEYLHHEFYQWEIPKRKTAEEREERRRRRRSGETHEKRETKRSKTVDPDKVWFEDFNRYGTWLTLQPQKINQDRRKEESMIKSIKVYNWVLGSDYDFLAMIVIETVTGRSVVISECDRVDSFEMHIDKEPLLQHWLNFNHHDTNETDNKERYELRYHFHQEGKEE
ncbi:MAG: hypothetical protein AAF573_10765 [Bacteroidota bacterium]